MMKKFADFKLVNPAVLTNQRNHRIGTLKELAESAIQALFPDFEVNTAKAEVLYSKHKCPGFVRKIYDAINPGSITLEVKADKFNKWARNAAFHMKYTVKERKQDANLG